MATYYIFVDTDATPGGGTVSTTAATAAADPYEGIVEAWDGLVANDMDLGDIANFYLKGSTDDDAGTLGANEAALFLTGLTPTGTGNSEINFYPWDEYATADDGRYIGDADLDTDFYFFTADIPGTTDAGPHLIDIDLDEFGTTYDCQVKFYGLQFFLLTTDGASSQWHSMINCGESGARTDVIFDKCRVISSWASGESGAGATRTIRLRGGCKTFLARNCIITGGRDALNESENFTGSGDRVTRCYNNTFLRPRNRADGDGGVATEGNTLVENHYKNNAIIHDSNIEGYNGSMDWQTRDYNGAVANTGGSDWASDTNGVRIAHTDIGNYGGGTGRSTDVTPSGDMLAAGDYNGNDSNIPTDDIRDDPRNTGSATALGAFANPAGEGGGGGTNPKGPFGLPLHGPFAGPVGP